MVTFNVEIDYIVSDDRHMEFTIEADDEDEAYELAWSQLPWDADDPSVFVAEAI